MSLNYLSLVATLLITPTTPLSGSNFNASLNKQTESQTAYFSNNLKNSYKKGESAVFYIDLENAFDLSAITFEIHYDSQAIKIDNASDNSYKAMSDIKIGADTIYSSYLFNEELDQSQGLISISFTVKSDTTLTQSFFDIKVVEAYDSSLNVFNINGDYLSFFISENQELNKILFYFDLNKTTLKQNEILSIKINSYDLNKLNAGTLLLSYDKDLLDFESYEKGNYLNQEGIIFDINTGNPGSVSFSFINDKNNIFNDLITINLKAKENLTSSCFITLTPSSLFDLDNNQFSSEIVSTLINFEFDNLIGSDDSVTSSIKIDETTKTCDVTLQIPENSKLAAGDFDINFDVKFLTYSSHEFSSLSEIFDICYLNESKAGTGNLHLSLLKFNNDSVIGNLLTIHFKFTKPCENFDTKLNIIGSDIVDITTNPLKDINQSHAIKAANLSHSYGEWTVTKEATCTETGIKERVCSVCGEKETETIPLIEHHGSWQVTKEPTCKDEGVESLICDHCGTVIETRPIEKTTEHSYGEWTATKEATCTETGLKERVCSVCGEKETETIPLIEHHGSWQVTKEPTYDEEGLESYVCSVCHEVIQTRKIPKLEQPNNSNGIILWSVIGSTAFVAIAIIIIISIKFRHKMR